MSLKIEVVLSSKSSLLQGCILHHHSWIIGSTIGPPNRDRPDVLRLTSSERTGVKVNHLVISFELVQFTEGSHSSPKQTNSPHFMES